MNGVDLVKAELEGYFRLVGELSFDTVPNLVERGEELFDGSPVLCIDLSGVDRADSAGLALLIEWTRSAREEGKQIRFVNIPAQMRDIARVSGLDNVLPFSREDFSKASRSAG